MGVIRIDTVDDERLAEFRDLLDPDLAARHGLFVAEGRLVVRRLLADGRLEARALLVTDAALASLEDLLVTRPALPIYLVSQPVMNRVTGFDIHRGCLGLGARPPARHWRSLLDGARRLVVLEQVGNPDNVGAVFRNVAAFGAGGVLLQSACADPLYRKAIRTSMAASLSVPFATATPWPGVLRDLGDAGWATIAMTPTPDAPLLKDAVARVAGRPVALVLGHEGDGLTRDALDACDLRARIPVAATVDSLNVATAAALGLYEIGR